MPVIPPSRQFEGSDLSQNAGFRYIKPEIPQLIVSAKENKEGLHIFFLPSYKQDAHGNGVWYKKFKIRNNFGTATKERYMIQNINEDPVEYFAKNFKMFYKEEAELKEEVRNGMTFKVYPAYGNTSDRVVYNVLQCLNAEKGVQVFEIPLFNGASLIDAYHRKPSLSGQPVPLICDPTRCTPVFVQCTSGGGNTPWSIQPDLSQAAPLPEQLSSSEYLINLDEIFIPKPKEELIEKLEAYFGREKFDRCMAGFAGMPARVVATGFNPQMPQASKPVATIATTPTPAATVAPAVSKFSLPSTLNIPKAPTVAAVSPAPVSNSQPAEAPAAKEVASVVSNPMASKLTREAAMEFLNQE